MSYLELTGRPEYPLLKAPETSGDPLCQKALELIAAPVFDIQELSSLIVEVPTINDIVNGTDETTLHGTLDIITARVESSNKIIPTVKSIVQELLKQIEKPTQILDVIDHLLQTGEFISKNLVHCSPRDFLIATSLLGVSHAVCLFRDGQISEKERKKALSYVLYFATLHNLLFGVRTNAFLFSINPEKTGAPIELLEETCWIDYEDPENLKALNTHSLLSLSLPTSPITSFQSGKKGRMSFFTVGG